MDKKRVVAILIFVFIFFIAIILSIIHYNGKYSVYFETGTSDVFLTRYVSKNDKVVEPPIPNKDGYIFKEWQLNGKKYDFDEQIKSDTVLTAKWVKEEYVTITFDTSSDDELESRKILKGEPIDDLPILYKDNYKFIGWFLNDELYNNEEIYNDITLVARFEMNEINNNYKIGDTVKIVGKYSDSAYSKYDYNSLAIGWEREIVNIIEDSEFPYAIGYNDEITGYFKVTSIELK